LEFHLNLKVQIATSFITFKVVIPPGYPRSPLSMCIEDTYNLKTKEVEQLDSRLTEYLQTEQQVYVNREAVYPSLE